MDDKLVHRINNTQSKKCDAFLTHIVKTICICESKTTRFQRWIGQNISNRASFLIKWMLGDFAVFLVLGHQNLAKMASTREFIAIVVMVHWPTISVPLSFLSHLMSFPSSLNRRRFRTLTSPSSMAASEPAGSVHSSASRFSASALLRRAIGMVGMM